MLRVNNLSFSYGEVQTLNGVNLSIDRGEMVSVIGRNGVGKTTLVRNILGLERASAGTVSLEDEDLSSRPAHYRANKGMGYVPQGRMIFPLLTVRENLLTGLGHLPRSEQFLPDHIFELFPVLNTMMQRRGGDLSGGQQQQLAIARALVINPKFLILDEPTEGIQPNIVQEIGDVILRLNRELGLTVLVVEQKLPFVRRVASHFHIMSKGAVVASDVMSGLTEALIKEHLSV